jgi:aminomuconate-semialdehyde/2-hydroxymuconate-6-semialdehyde dehydrogenase
MDRIDARVAGEPDGAPRRTFDAVNPATGRVTGAVTLSTADDVDRAVQHARAALRGPWAGRSVEERALLLERIAAGIEARFEEFLTAEILDTGKPRSFAAVVDIPRAAANFRTFASLLRGLGDETWHTHRGDVRALNYTRRMPLGVVGVICPWNLPLLLLTWKVAPALAMGNAVVIKPSEETPRTATLLADVVREAGAPPGLCQVVHGFGAGCVGEALVRHPDIRALTFTGETGTGRAIMAAAAPHLKPLSFELGGKNAALIFEDCDLEAALAGTTRSVFANCGQVCLCSERVYVQRGLFDAFVEGLARRAADLRMGDPLDPATTLGPLISAAQHQRVSGFVAGALARGAQAVHAPVALDLPDAFRGGSWHAPTILTGLPENDPFVRQEVFGPVCHVTPFDTEEEAVALANDTDYGLCAAVWTGGLSRAHRVAASLQVGLVWVNDWFLRDLRTPFGGTGISGIGREGGLRSFEFYSEIQNICIRVHDDG